MASFTALAGEHHGAVGADTSVLRPVCEQVRLAECDDADRVEPSDTRGFVGSQACCSQETPSSTRPDHAYTCPRGAMAIGYNNVKFQSRH